MRLHQLTKSLQRICVMVLRGSLLKDFLRWDSAQDVCGMNLLVMESVVNGWPLQELRAEAAPLLRQSCSRAEWGGSIVLR